MFVLVDRKKKKVHPINLDFARASGFTDAENRWELKKQIDVDLEEYFFRVLKTTVLEAVIGVSWVNYKERRSYKIAMYKLKKGKTL